MPVLYAEPDQPSLDVTKLSGTEARQASRDCEDGCGGAGHIAIFDPEYDGRKILQILLPDGRIVQRLMRTVAYCRCAAGRWVMMRQQATCPDMFRRTHDLHDVINGHTARRWLAYDPRPMPDPEPGDMNNPPHWRELVRRFMSETEAPKTKLQRTDLRHDPILRAAGVSIPDSEPVF